MLAPALGREAGLLEAGQRLLEVGGDDGDVTDLRDERALARHQVDLGAAPFEPGVLPQRLRRLDLLEAEQAEEADGVLDLVLRDLDPDVMEHGQEFTEVPPTRNLLSAMVPAMAITVTDREAPMAEWNEARLDEVSGQVGYLSGRVDEMSNRIDDLGKRVEQGFAQLDARSGKLEDRFGSLQRTLLQMGGVIVAALLGLIATQI